MGIHKLLIANRGEIAVRVIRAALDLGIATVQVHSDADADMLAVRIADEAVNIGPAQAAKSYLNTEAILKAAKDTGADAIHPGYGFLSENGAFAQAVEDAGMIFVGPSGETIKLMGDKAAARAQAAKAGVPTVPGSDGVITDMEEAAGLAVQIGFPVMIKASAGGGGRGIRIAEDAESFRKLAPQASSEAKAAFGDGGIYIEKVIERARHIEVQILGDGTDAIHCWERECSLQRRRQKVWEEAPSTALDEETRQTICASAADLARSVGYRGAGTVEYLYDDETGKFYFIEMNTRIQVEHPVTEMITGLDLVAEMIRIAGGEPLRHKQGDIGRTGHSIEVRLNAEDPSNGFMPFPGTVSALEVPTGPGVRFDHMLYYGYTVPPFYDSLLGKLIVHGETREAACARLARALAELRIGGLATTAPLFQALLDADDVKQNRVHTKWLEPWLETHGDTIARKMQTEGDTAA
ncbi:acetyl-CoA carboxylase biotin carboxylase subunit [Thalassococcus sp. S3]|uniref:acetyl-CoA carboxylase biotin carboxylase subunit n=1 Tax=Thalassococcus sp. S3 TaxID=2017482 RepID=UPI001024517E|nr:acetyl-CoA carboxylase biotin carboxylase subunit [Thalassococcus sp. S3]QBF30516.1 acetyl-CoA carboxylase biotin carboxylase subunit [Thalassococcus sp. S3]